MAATLRRYAPSNQTHNPPKSVRGAPTLLIRRGLDEYDDVGQGRDDAIADGNRSRRGQRTPILERASEPCAARVASASCFRALGVSARSTRKCVVFEPRRQDGMSPRRFSIGCIPEHFGEVIFVPVQRDIGTPQDKADFSEAARWLK